MMVKTNFFKKLFAGIISIGILYLIYYLGIEKTVILFYGLILSAIILHLLLKLSMVFNPNSNINSNYDESIQPFVTIQVACKSEPAHLVIKTLKALAQLDYPNYEVLVIHSNDTNVENYTKIQKFVENCEKSFTFVHLDTVDGFKAGALNYLNKHYVSDKTDIIAIVDCDYIVEPDFLNKTVGYFKDPNVAIVQLPQSYYNVNDDNVGLFYEFRSFFRMVMHQTQRLNLVTFTGTMGLIRADLMKSGVNWNQWCITEDSEVGVYVNTLGYRGVYLDEALGQGLMPFDYLSFAKQRQRWTYGNMQIFMKDCWNILLNPKLTIKQKVAFFSLVTAWFHGELCLAILYALTAVLTHILPSMQWRNLSLAVVITLLLSILIHAVYFMAGMRDDATIIERFKAFLVHYGILWVMSTAWLLCLFKQPLGFVVTNKERFDQQYSLLVHWKEFIIPIIFLLATMLNLIARDIMQLELMIIGGYILMQCYANIILYHTFEGYQQVLPYQRGKESVS